MKRDYKEPEFKIVELNFEDICSASQLATTSGDNNVDGNDYHWWDTTKPEA